MSNEKRAEEAIKKILGGLIPDHTEPEIAWLAAQFDAVEREAREAVERETDERIIGKLQRYVEELKTLPENEIRKRAMAEARKACDKENERLRAENEFLREKEPEKRLEHLAMIFGEQKRLEARVAELEKALREGAATIQQVTDALAARCRKDQPHDHEMLRQLQAGLAILDRS